LYTVEKKGKSLPSDERCQLRPKDAVPILTAFYAWLDKSAVNLLPKSPMEKAVGYTLTNGSTLKDIQKKYYT